MSEIIIPGSNLALAFSDTGWEYGTGNSGVAGYNSGYKVAILRFDAPALSGAAKTLDISMVISKVATAGANIRWALCKSDANRDMYLDTSGEVADENQIAAGEISFNNLTNVLGMQTFKIPGKGVRKGTWYLILWASELKSIYIRSVVSSAGTHSVSIICTSGILWIKTTEGIKPFGAYNGQRKRINPYVKT